MDKGVANNTVQRQLERLDRQVHVMGTGAARRLLDTVFLVIGLDTTGCEIARNILLGGCSRLILCDDSCATPDDAESNFFVTKEDLPSQEVHTVTSRSQIFSKRLGPLSPDSLVEWISEHDLAARIASASSFALCPPDSATSDFDVVVADVIVIANASLETSYSNITMTQRAILLDSVDTWKAAIRARLRSHKKSEGQQRQRCVRPRFIHVRCAHLLAAFYNDFCSSEENDKFLFVENAQDNSIVPLRVELSSIIAAATARSTAETPAATTDEKEEEQFKCGGQELKLRPHAMKTASVRLLLDDTASSKATLEAIQTNRAMKITLSRSVLDASVVVGYDGVGSSTISVVCRVVTVEDILGVRVDGRTHRDEVSGNSSNAPSQHYFINVVVAAHLQDEAEHTTSNDGKLAETATPSFDNFLCRVRSLLDSDESNGWMAFATPASVPQEMSQENAGTLHAARCRDAWSQLPQHVQMISPDDDDCSSFVENGNTAPVAICLLDAAFSCNGIPTATPHTDENHGGKIGSRCRELLECRKDEGSTIGRSRRRLICSFAKLGPRTFLPVASMLAGIVAQEAMKAATHQHRPTVGVWSFDARWILNSRPCVGKDEATASSAIHVVDHKGDTSNIPCTANDESVVECLFGLDGAMKLANANLLLVGAGAIGCEYLKHFAVMGIACGKRGRLDVTDPDHIEVSNLSRQFLFQLGDVKQSKSSVAVAKARKRARGLKARSFQKALTPAVCGSWKPSTKAASAASSGLGIGTFHADVLASFDAFVGAVDNNEARNFLDDLAGRFSTPLLDSGTLGLQGHVVSVVPDVTGRLTDGNSPSADISGGNGVTSIPFCTLHFFPSNVQHCIQWSMNAFNELLSSPWPHEVISANVSELANAGAFKLAFSAKYPSQVQEKLRVATNILETLTFFYDWKVADVFCDDNEEGVIAAAQGASGGSGLRHDRLAFAIAKLLHRRYMHMFVNPIDDVLRQHPPTLDAQGNSTDAFWKEKPQGRPPRLPEAVMLRQFVVAAAPLLCARVTENEDMTVAVVSLITNDQSWSDILNAIEKESQSLPAKKYTPPPPPSPSTVEQPQSVPASNKADDDDEVFEALVDRISAVAGKIETFSSKVGLAVVADVSNISFDKDESTGRHVDLLTVCTNVRAWCYFIPAAEHLDVKRIAGRIVPAFISTTAAVTSFAVMQLISLLLILKSEENSSVPSTAAPQRSGQQQHLHRRIENNATSVCHSAALLLRECLRDINLSLSDTSLSFVMELSAPRRIKFPVIPRLVDDDDSMQTLLPPRPPPHTSWTCWRIITPTDMTLGELLVYFESTYQFSVAQVVDVVTSQIVFDRVTDGADAPRCKFQLLTFLREIWSVAAASSVAVAVAPPLRNGAELRVRGYSLADSLPGSTASGIDVPLVVYRVEVS